MRGAHERRPREARNGSRLREALLDPRPVLRWLIACPNGTDTLRTAPSERRIRRAGRIRFHRRTSTDAGCVGVPYGVVEGVKRYGASPKVCHTSSTHNGYPDYVHGEYPINTFRRSWSIKFSMNHFHLLVIKYLSRFHVRILWSYNF